MANYTVSNADPSPAANSLFTQIEAANATTANDNLVFTQDITLTPDQVLNLTTPTTGGNLRFRSDQTTPGSLFTLTVQNDLAINDITPATAQPSFTIGPFVLQIGNGGTAGGISGNLRADDGGVLAFNRSVDTTYTGTLSVEQEDNALYNNFAGTTVTLDGSQGTNGLAIRASQGTGAADEYDLTIGGAGDGLISGIIGDGGLASAPGTITKEGDGTWTFSGVNTYLGVTTVSEGVLKIQNAAGLGGNGNGAAESATVVETGGTLAIEQQGQGAGLVIGPEALSLSGSGSDGQGALQNIAGTNTFSGAITLTGDARINSDADTLTLTGQIDGANGLTLGGEGDGEVSGEIGAAVTGLTKDGTGTWTLSTTNTYGGGTTIKDGMLLLVEAGAASTEAISFEATANGFAVLGVDDGAEPNGGQFDNTLNDFGFGDALDLQDFGFTATSTATVVGNLLIVSDGAGTTDTFTLSGNTAAEYGVANDGEGGTLVGALTTGQVRVTDGAAYSAADSDSVGLIVYGGTGLSYTASTSTSQAGDVLLTVGNGHVTEVLNLGTPAALSLDFSTNVADVSLSGGAFGDNLRGGLGQDSLTGGAGNDVLDGGTGDDTMVGGTGNDTYTVRDADDTVTELGSQGTDTVKSTVSYTLTDNVERLVLAGRGNVDGTGNDAANIVKGNTGDNQIDGGDGRDVLTGFGGNDTFVFSVAPGAGNVDRITDFNLNDATHADKIALDVNVFSGLDFTSGTLSDTQFASIGAGEKYGADVRIVYREDKGALYYDADGYGGNGAVLITALTGNPALSATDIVEHGILIS